MSTEPLRTGEPRTTDTRHLATVDGETLCGRHLRTRPIRTEATARVTADRLCEQCRKIARDEYWDALLTVYELADE